ncbi:MAG TPA: hypothetical protein ENJ79_02990 [Gammaproteobacteria bacterium]|nr:hypothetical protein [Gammaproteobacteria bacterium]
MHALTFGQKNRTLSEYIDWAVDQALCLCGLTLEGDHHRALADAKNIARMLPWIVGGERIGK